MSSVKALSKTAIKSTGYLGSSTLAPKIVAPASAAFFSTAAPSVDKTIGYVVAQKAVESQHMNALRVVHQKYSWSFEQLKKYSEAAATGLLEIGVRHGDVVGLLSSNTAENYVVQLAAAKVGASVLHLAGVQSAAELEAAITKNNLRVLVSPSKHEGSDVVAFAHQIFPELVESEREVVDLHSSKAPNFRSFVLTDRRVDGFHLLKNILIYGPFTFYEHPLRPNARHITPKDAAYVFPQCTLTHTQVLKGAAALADKVQIKTADRALVAGALSAPFTVLSNIAALTRDAVVVLTSEGFNADEAAQSLASEQISAIFASPSQIEAILSSSKLPKPEASQVKTVVVDGTASAELVVQIKAKLNATNVQSVNWETLVPK